ncbi:MAG TPA: hypothetical protein VM243_16620 [Phycisphaerae bacterium]|nr:hypothetical protein [Phycisphaerae bacterium]
MSDDELQDRTCRCCGRGYKYPVPKSSATRFHCERCVGLDAEVRALFEHFNKRVRRLTAEVEKLKRGGEAS